MTNTITIKTNKHSIISSLLETINHKKDDDIVVTDCLIIYDMATKDYQWNITTRTIFVGTTHNHKGVVYHDDDKTFYKAFSKMFKNIVKEI